MARKSLTKHPFTLFEMLLVITLVAMALGICALPISKAVKSERFERGVDQVAAKIALAQELMLDFRTDVTLLLEMKQHELCCSIKIERHLPAHLERSINRYNKIKGIEEMAFNHDRRDSIQLQFDGTVGTTPQGELSLSAPQKEAILILHGYPAQIVRGKHEKKKKCEALYPEEIVSFI